MANKPIIALTDAIIFTGEAFVDGHSLILRDGFVADIAANGHIPGEAHKSSCRDKILAPGFIDCQVNGGGNVLFNATPTAEAVIAITQAHQKSGTTRLLPTCISDTFSVMQQALMATRKARQQHAGILGIHFEGPHLNPDRRGAHPLAPLRDPTPDDLSLYRPEDDEIILLTLSPERVAPDQIRQLRSQGAILSLGHTDADHAAIHAALDVGATGFTHLFNAMGQLSARAPGPAGAALDDRDSWCGLIADGIHVSAEMIRLALRAKTPGKIFLVSDAMPPAASDKPQSFRLGDEIIRVEDGRCLNGEDCLAGSTITLGDAVRYCIKRIGIEPEEAFRMASTYPAAFLGLDKLGKLLPGYRADIVALSNDFSPTTVWIDGVRQEY